MYRRKRSRVKLRRSRQRRRTFKRAQTGGGKIGYRM